MPSPSDPRRLPLRNHYQEGPGFLFLATQGGRPPSPPRARRPAQVVRRRRAALRRWQAGESVATICAELGYSRASLYRWRERYRAGGLAAVLDHYRPGGRRRLPELVERLVVSTRLLTYWNSHRLAAEFSRRGIWHRRSPGRVPGDFRGRLLAGPRKPLVGTHDGAIEPS